MLRRSREFGVAIPTGDGQKTWQRSGDENRIEAG
jgi:hypothetical protein